MKETKGSVASGAVELSRGADTSEDTLYYREKWPWPLKDRDYTVARRSVGLSVCLSACLPACMSVCLSVCMSVCLSVEVELIFAYIPRSLSTSLNLSLALCAVAFTDCAKPSC